MKPGSRLGVLDRSAPLGLKTADYMERHMLPQEILIDQVTRGGLRLVSFDSDFAAASAWFPSTPTSPALPTEPDTISPSLKSLTPPGSSSRGTAGRRSRACNVIPSSSRLGESWRRIQRDSAWLLHGVLRQILHRCERSPSGLFVACAAGSAR